MTAAALAISDQPEVPMPSEVARFSALLDRRGARHAQ